MFLSLIEPVLEVLRIELRVGVSTEVEVDAERVDSADAESDDREDSVRRLSTGASTTGVATTVAMPEDWQEAQRCVNVGRDWKSGNAKGVPRF